jgi:hypothetical protein
MAQRSIKILRTAESDRVGFQPDLFGVEVGEPLHAAIGDAVSWANLTDRPRSLVSTNPVGVPLPQNILPGDSSDLFQIDQDVEYKCTDATPTHHIII